MLSTNLEPYSLINYVNICGNYDPDDKDDDKTI